jgi:hypothetical protein
MAFLFKIIYYCHYVVKVTAKQTADQALITLQTNNEHVAADALFFKACSKTYVIITQSVGFIHLKLTHTTHTLALKKMRARV